MSHVDELRTRIVGVLRSDPCQRIRFKNVVSVTGFNYGYVADMVQREIITIEEGDTGIWAGEYNPFPNPTKKFVLPCDTWQQIKAGDMLTISLLVHEATHALYDVLAKGKWVSWQDSEVTAYLAQAIYLLNCSVHPDVVIASFGRRMYALADKIMDYRGPCIYECTRDDINPIRANTESLYMRLDPGRSPCSRYRSIGIPWPDDRPSIYR